jgi:hypothetical protein
MFENTCFLSWKAPIPLQLFEPCPPPLKISSKLTHRPVTTPPLAGLCRDSHAAASEAAIQQDAAWIRGKTKDVSLFGIGGFGHHGNEILGNSSSEDSGREAGQDPRVHAMRAGHPNSEQPWPEEDGTGRPQSHTYSCRHSHEDMISPPWDECRRPDLGDEDQNVRVSDAATGQDNATLPCSTTTFVRSEEIPLDEEFRELIEARYLHSTLSKSGCLQEKMMLADLQLNAGLSFEEKITQVLFYAHSPIQLFLHMRLFVFALLLWLALSVAYVGVCASYYKHNRHISGYRYFRFAAVAMDSVESQSHTAGTRVGDSSLSSSFAFVLALNTSPAKKRGNAQPGKRKSMEMHTESGLNQRLEITLLLDGCPIPQMLSTNSTIILTDTGAITLAFEQPVAFNGWILRSQPVLQHQQHLPTHVTSASPSRPSAAVEIPMPNDDARPLAKILVMEASTDGVSYTPVNSQFDQYIAVSNDVTTSTESDLSTQIQGEAPSAQHEYDVRPRLWWLIARLCVPAISIVQMLCVLSLCACKRYRQAKWALVCGQVAIALAFSVAASSWKAYTIPALCHYSFAVLMATERHAFTIALPLGLLQATCTLVAFGVLEGAGFSIMHWHGEFIGIQTAAMGIASQILRLWVKRRAKKTIVEDQKRYMHVWQETMRHHGFEESVELLKRLVHAVEKDTAGHARQYNLLKAGFGGKLLRSAFAVFDHSRGECGTRPRDFLSPVQNLDQVYVQGMAVDLLLTRKVQDWAWESNGCFPIAKMYAGRVRKTYVEWRKARDNKMIRSRLSYGSIKSLDRAIQKIFRCVCPIGCMYVWIHSCVCA